MDFRELYRFDMVEFAQEGKKGVFIHKSKFDQICPYAATPSLLLIERLLYLIRRYQIGLDEEFT